MSTIDTIRHRFALLSPRQKEVAFLLTDGMTNGQIAAMLQVTIHTVKAHRAEVMQRMEARSFADLVNQVQRSRTNHFGSDDAPLHIIVVEDDAWYRDYLTENLGARGFSAVGVADGSAFKVSWAEAPADIVILDIELGRDKESGLSIASKLQVEAACGIVIVTAHGEQDDRLKGLSLGADFYFSKPVCIDELTICLTNLGRRIR